MQMTLLLMGFVCFLTKQLKRWELPLTDIANTGTVILRDQEFSFGQVTSEVLIRCQLNGDVQLVSGYGIDCK